MSTTAHLMRYDVRPKRREPPARRRLRVKTKLRIAAALVAVFGAASALISPASAASGVAVGMLSCNVASGWGFIFGSSRALNCTLTGTNGVAEHYTGNIT